MNSETTKTLKSILDNENNDINTKIILIWSIPSSMSSGY